MAEPFIGQVMMFAGNFAPRGWAFCDGQLLPISQYTAVFSLLGTTYGGDGRTTFGLPDLRGRAPIHVGQGPGLSDRRWGERGGAEAAALTLAQMPAHTHAHEATLHAQSLEGDQTGPDGGVIAKSGQGDPDFYSGAPDTAMRAGAVTVAGGDTGGSQQHQNMPPYLAMYYIIALVGVFPSRN